MSQKDEILQYLKQHKIQGITPSEALAKFGCFRLAARILELKDSMHPIDGIMEKRNGKTYKRYFYCG